MESIFSETWMAAAFLRPVVAGVVMLLVVIPLMALVWSIMPDGKVRDFLFKSRGISPY